jgi:hypothetical protein
MYFDSLLMNHKHLIKFSMILIISIGIYFNFAFLKKFALTIRNIMLTIFHKPNSNFHLNNGT